MKAIFIIGEICSGKSTFASNIEALNIKKIELGQLVRDLHKTTDRIFDASLDTYLTEKVAEIKSTCMNKDIILILGCRQVSLLKMISELFSEVDYWYLQVPREELRKRYYERNDPKDSLDFEEVLKRDDELGLKELKLHLLNETTCHFKQNF